MLDYIPFDMQSEILKMLPVKSLVQFRSVSKQWKSFIDNPEFINSYHINHPNPQHHFLVQYMFETLTSIIDDNTFPQQKFALTPPEPLIDAEILGSIDRLLCFYGWYKDTQQLVRHMAVLSNPSIRNRFLFLSLMYYHNLIPVFGVSRHTNQPKLVKINVVEDPIKSWEVQVFTLGPRVWKTVYTGWPYNSCYLTFNPVCVDGIIYGFTYPSSILSFDLKTDKFGEVFLSERLRGFKGSHWLFVEKVNVSLSFLEFYEEAWMSVCGVWIIKYDVNEPFTKMYTIKVEGNSMVRSSVLGFRNNGEVVLRLNDDDDDDVSQVEVYEPSSGRINSVGISGSSYGFL